MHVYEIPQTDFVESLSIPVQQIARVIAEGESITESEAVYIQQLMDLDKIPTAYQPACSDNIKNLIRQKGNASLESDKATFFKMWFSIGIEHPKTYFDAYVAQTNGYW